MFHFLPNLIEIRTGNVYRFGDNGEFDLVIEANGNWTIRDASQIRVQGDSAGWIRVWDLPRNNRPVGWQADTVSGVPHFDRFGEYCGTY